MDYDELDNYLKSRADAQNTRLVKTLGESDFEKTDLVVQGDKTESMFVRKIISGGPSDANENAYALICDAQHRKNAALIDGFPKILGISYGSDELIVDMEYVRGTTLDAYLESSLDRIKSTIELFPQIAQCVRALHEMEGGPIIHRDLKPANVLVSKGRAVLIDFGVSRRYRSDATEDTTHFGTRGYAPPEQYGFGQTDERSDVYALGQLLAFCVTGVNPGTRSNAWDASDFSSAPALAPVVAKATQLDPDRRYQSVRELIEAFAMAVEKTVAVPGSDRQSAEQPSSKHAKLGMAWNAVLIVCAVCFLLICVTVPFQPNEYWESYPLPFTCAFCYMSTFIPTVVIAIGLFDKRRLRQRYPLLGKLKARYMVPAAVLAFFVIVIVFSGWSLLLGYFPNAR